MLITNKEEQKQYNIKEYAVGNVNKRNMFTTDIPSIVEQNLTSQIYQSYFDHSDKIIQWWETHQNDNGENTVAGYKKSVSIKDIIIDIDDNDDLNNAKKSASIILNRLKNKYGINLIYTYPNFSGSKGFHIRIPSELFGGFESSPELPEIIKSICKKIAEDIKIDETIYHTTAIIRVPNTINTKKNLYAIPLTDIDVTNLGIEKILEMAERPQSLISRSRYFKSYPKLVELKNNVIKELSSKSKISTKAERVNAEQEGSTKSFNLSDEIKLDNNTTKLVKEIDDKTPIFCPFCDHTKRSHPNSANAFIDKNNEGFYYIYCSSESKTYWQKSFRVSGIFTKEKNEYYKIKRMG
ncbi:MAG: hypothetical protein KDC90_19425, partial [Ignavibacteriae bacterium]|nr:hypothetical protein [Ignavibacteriota bacterium]